jgi:hypothetical protein
VPGQGGSVTKDAPKDASGPARTIAQSWDPIRYVFSDGFRNGKGLDVFCRNSGPSLESAVSCPSSGRGRCPAPCVQAADVGYGMTLSSYVLRVYR